MASSLYSNLQHISGSFQFHSLGYQLKVLDAWTKDGGVLLMGYEMFRLLATRKTKTRKRKANAGPELIDIDLEEKNTGLQMGRCLLVL